MASVELTGGRRRTLARAEGCGTAGTAAASATLGRAHAQAAGLAGIRLFQVGREHARVHACASGAGRVVVEQLGATASAIVRARAPAAAQGGNVERVRQGQIATLAPGDALALHHSEPARSVVLTVLEADAGLDFPFFGVEQAPAAGQRPERGETEPHEDAHREQGVGHEGHDRPRDADRPEHARVGDKRKAEGEAARASKGGEGVMLMLCGLPGAGKSTIARALAEGEGGVYVRICQDVLKKKAACLTRATLTVRRRQVAVIDRTNVDAAARRDFATLARRLGVPVCALALAAPASVCVERVAARVTHEGGVTGGAGAAIINRFAKQWKPPDAAAEGLHAAATLWGGASVGEALNEARRLVEAAREAHGAAAVE